MREILVKPAEQILIKDEETGKEYVATFNVRCTALFQEVIQKHKDIPETTTKMVAEVLYASINASDNAMTFEEAHNMAIKMDMSAGVELLNIFTESLMNSLNDEQKKTVQKEIDKAISQQLN